MIAALPRPRAVLFDLDDTLITAYRTPQRTWYAIISEHAEALGEHDTLWVTAEVIARVLAFLSDEDGRKLWRLEGDTTRRRVVRMAFHQLNLARPDSSPPLHGVDADRIADRFESYLEETITLKPDAHRVLDTLHCAGLMLGLLTNGQSARQHGKLARFDLARRFDAIQIEEEAGFGKPEPQAYLSLLGTLAVAPDQAWMVGDDLLWDIEAPKALGLATVLLDESGAQVVCPHADAVITRLSELPGLLAL